MNRLLIEINRNRILMNLPLITESIITPAVLEDLVKGSAMNEVKAIIRKLATKLKMTPDEIKSLENTGLAGFQKLSNKMEKRVVLEVILEVLPGKLTELEKVIEDTNPTLISDIEKYVQQGVPENQIKSILSAELQDIPPSLFDKIFVRSYQKLFTVENIENIIRSLETSTGKNINKLTEPLISSFRIANRDASPLEVAQSLVKQLPPSFWSLENLSIISKKLGGGVVNLLLGIKKLWGKPGFWGTTGRIATVLIAVASYEGYQYSKDHGWIKSDYDRIQSKYPCLVGFVRPGAESDFEVQDSNRKWQPAIFKNERLWYWNPNTQKIVGEVTC
jgi:hypothetical protein